MMEGCFFISVILCEIKKLHGVTKSLFLRLITEEITATHQTTDTYLIFLFSLTISA